MGVSIVLWCASVNSNGMLVRFQLGEPVIPSLTSTASMETLVWEAEGNSAYLRVIMDTQEWYVRLR